MATAASQGKKTMNKETPSYSMFAVSNDKWHGIVRITRHDPDVQARGPPRKGAFSLHTLIPLNSFFCYLLQEPLCNREAPLFVRGGESLRTLMRLTTIALPCESIASRDQQQKTSNKCSDKGKPKKTVALCTGEKGNL